MLFLTAFPGYRILKSFLTTTPTLENKLSTPTPPAFKSPLQKQDSSELSKYNAILFSNKTSNKCRDGGGGSYELSA